MTNRKKMAASKKKQPKKGTATKKTRSKKQNKRSRASSATIKPVQKKVTKEIIGLIITSLGVMALIGLYAQEAVGLFGDWTAWLFGGLFGWPAALLPLLMIGYGISILVRKKRHGYLSGFVFAFIFVLLISAMVQTAYYASNADEFVNMAFDARMQRFFINGTVLQGGGAAGALVAMPLISIFQVLGTVIILSTVLLIVAMYITNIGFIEAIVVIARSLKKMVIWLAHRAIAAGKGVWRIGTSKRKKSAKKPKLRGFETEKKSEKAVKPVALKKKKFEWRIWDALKRSDFEWMEEHAAQRMPKAQSTDESDHEKPKESPKQPFDFSIETKKDQPKPTKTSPSQQKTKMPQSEAPTKNTDKDDVSARYEYPDVALLEDPPPDREDQDGKDITLAQASKLIETLDSFGVEAAVSTITKGPAVIRYELRPKIGVRAKRFAELADDIALNLAAKSVRVEAPIPGKDAVGIEIPKRDVTPVFFKEMITNKAFIRHKSKLSMVLGKDISGQPVIADIAKMPHLLVAGATGSGKSVCINSLVMSILFKATPDEVRMMMIDPKMVELSRYNGIPHLLIPVVTDPKKASGALLWVVQEMLDRYNLFHENKVVDIESFNALMAKTEKAEKMPQILIIIDELADLMNVARNETEDSIQRLAQMARAAGMHLVIATQRPSVNVITGVIKANIPSRISFAVSSPQDSRTILDKGGAEKLLGKGDMLFHPTGESIPVRIQGTYVSNEEVAKTVEEIKRKTETAYDQDIMEKIENESIDIKPKEEIDADDLLPQAIEMVIEQGQASTSYVQRKLSIGYARAGRIIDQMEERGIIGGYEGSKPRKVLISKQEWQQMKMTEEPQSIKDLKKGIFGK